MAASPSPRVAEWLTSCVLVGFACTLALPGNSLSGPAFRLFRDLNVDEATVAVPMALIGAARIGALVVNGAWRRSPVARMAGAIAGCALFAMLAAAALWPTLAGIEGYLSPACTTYLALAIADGVAADRSARDARLGAQSH